MNFLRGMMDIIPGNGTAVLQLTNEKYFYSDEIYNGKFKYYCADFLLNENITIQGKTKDLNMSGGKIVLTFERDTYYNPISLKKCIYMNARWTMCKCCSGTVCLGYCGFTLKKSTEFQLPFQEIVENRVNIEELDEKSWNEEINEFRQAFLNADPIIHDAIRKTNLQGLRFVKDYDTNWNPCC